MPEWGYVSARTRAPGQRWGKNVPLQTRLLASVSFDADGCWLWQAHRDTKGYPVLGYQGRKLRAYRAMYEVAVGPVPTGLELDHLCRVRNCVNPRHLEPVTHRINQLRGHSPMARQAAQTHCKRGHSFAEHAYAYQGQRVCRACVRIRKRKEGTKCRKYP